MDKWSRMALLNMDARQQREMLNKQREMSGLPPAESRMGVVLMVALALPVLIVLLEIWAHI